MQVLASNSACTCLPGSGFVTASICTYLLCVHWKRESPELITRLHPAPTPVDVRSSLAWCIDFVDAPGPIFLEMEEEENKKMVENCKAHVDGTSPVSPLCVTPSFIYLT